MLVRSKVENAASVWDPHTKEQISSIEKIQRRAARVVSNDHRKTSSVSKMLKELDWPTLENRRKAARLTTLYKIRKGAVKVKTPQACPIKITQRARSTVPTIHMQEGCTPLRFPPPHRQRLEQSDPAGCISAIRRRLPLFALAFYGTGTSQ